jgi:transcriptional regulator with XRE-family HTH domain
MKLKQFIGRTPAEKQRDIMFGKKLKAARLANNLTMSQVVKMLGINTCASLYCYENAEMIMPQEMRKLAIEKLGMMDLKKKAAQSQKKSPVKTARTTRPAAQVHNAAAAVASLGDMLKLVDKGYEIVIRKAV